MFVVVHVEVQLRGVLMTETVDLQIDDDVTLQNAVVEDEIGLEVVLVNEDALLTILEAETVSHLQEEPLKVVQNGRLLSFCQ